MSSTTLRILAVFAATAVQSFFLAAACKAGPLMDTLIGPTTPRYQAAPAAAPPMLPPAVAAPPMLPPAVVAPPVISIPAAPSSGACACAPSAASACNPCPPCPSPVTMTYAPQTAYRTTWARVPVTYYRPVTTADPVTGCPVTCMQPCTTTAWQVRRVPTSCWRSCWDSVRSLFSCRRRQVYALPVIAPPAIAAVAPAAGCSSCTPSLMTAPPQPAPYYRSAPGPAILAPPPAAAPPALPAPTSPSTSPGPTPADRPPSLNPSELENANPGSETRNYPPAPTNSAPSKDESAHWGGDRAEKPTWDPRLKPVPDPDSSRTSAPSGQAPQLLNPRDRTAFGHPVARAGAYTPIAWPDGGEAASGRPTRHPPQESWDDSGWRSLRP